MAKVIIVESLAREIMRRFKQESKKIFRHMRSLEDTPKKGKIVGVLGPVLIKELKYKKFRFYFLCHGAYMKFVATEDIQDAIIKFVRMSEKKDQQKVINEITSILRKLGEEGF